MRPVGSGAQGLIDDLQELALAESGRLAVDRAATDLAALLDAVVQAHRAAEAAGTVVALEDKALLAEVKGGREAADARADNDRVFVQDGSFRRGPPL